MGGEGTGKQGEKCRRGMKRREGWDEEEEEEEKRGRRRRRRRRIRYACEGIQQPGLELPARAYPLHPDGGCGGQEEGGGAVCRCYKVHRVNREGGGWLRERRKRRGEDQDEDEA